MQLGGTLSYSSPLIKKKLSKKRNLKVNRLIFGFPITRLIKILAKSASNKLDIGLNASIIAVERAITSHVLVHKEL